MSSKITIIGNLGADAELRYMRSGSGDRKRDKQNWYKVNLFGNSAEKIAQHLTKGTGLYVEGRLNPELWEGRDGKTRLTMNVNTTNVEFTGGKRSSQGSVPADVAEAPQSDVVDEDPIPF